MINRKCLISSSILFYLLFCMSVLPVTAKESGSSSLAFSIPANTFCDQSHTLELSLNITNISSESTDIKLELYDFDGNPYTVEGSSYNGTTSTLIPGIKKTIKPLGSATYHVTFGGKQTNCEVRPFTGVFTTEGKDTSFVASGFVSGTLGSVPVIINNGAPWKNNSGESPGTPPINKPVDVCSVENSDSIIHAMSSNSDQYGIARASSFNPNFDTQAFRAFDNTCYPWETKSGDKTGWIEYEFVNPKTVNKYSIRMKQNDPTYGYAQSPNSWVFEAYDGQNWIALDTQTNVTDWTPETAKEYSFKNTSSYNKYRLRITANNGGNLINISELGMMGY